jgi:hypothetical protein
MDTPYGTPDHWQQQELEEERRATSLEILAIVSKYLSRRQLAHLRYECGMITEQELNHYLTTKEAA